MNKENYQRFNNNFLRIAEAFMLIKEENFSIENLYKYLDFENSEEPFYFAASYLKALIEWHRYNKNFEIDINDSKYCYKIIKYLKISKAQIQKLIKKNIEPIIGMIDINFYIQRGEFYEQFKIRKKILKNLIEHIDRNIEITEEYIRYLPKNSFFSILELCKENIQMKICLKLEANEEKELEYLFDAGLDFTYEFKIIESGIKKGLAYFFRKSIKNNIDESSNGANEIEKEINKNFPVETYKKFPELMKYIDY